jgi:uncharacterized protein (TIGR02996 family)
MGDEELLVQAIHQSPGDPLAWLALADWLEEQGRADEAELLRLRQALTERPDVPDRPAREKRLQRLLAAGVRPYPVEIEGPAGLRFALVGPGSFLMGSPPGERGRWPDEGPQHLVTLPRAFYLARCPVTQAQWQELTGESPSRFRGADRPVDNVSWEDCLGLCGLLQERDGRDYRLPTEAEWEYACRAGTSTPYCSGRGLPALKKVGWCSYDATQGSAKETVPVGKFQPNAWGLFDMHGNLLEWCADWFGAYTAEPQVAPVCETVAWGRCLRGGSWQFEPRRARSAFRGCYDPRVRNNNYTCRPCLSAGG